MNNFAWFKNYLEISSDHDIIIFCLRRNILKEQYCKYCNELMILKPSKDNSDGWNYRCMTFKCGHFETTASVKRGSVLDPIRKSLREILRIICSLSNDQRLTDIVREVRTSMPTLGKIKKIAIRKMISALAQHHYHLGGPGCIVQVDEFKMNFSAKNRRGREASEQTWCLSMADTSAKPARAYLEILFNRRAETILLIIHDKIMPGSIIATDEWPSYRALGNDANYEHRTVCHKYNYVCPITGTHTQHVESLNNKIKLAIKARKGIRKEHRQDFIVEFMFLDFFKKGNIDAWLNLFIFEDLRR